MGKEGLEPSRLTTRDPKSRLSTNSSTSPSTQIIRYRKWMVNKCYNPTSIKILGGIVEQSNSYGISGERKKKTYQNDVLRDPLMD